MMNTNQNSQIVKNSILLTASLLALNFTPVFGQPGGTTAPPPANNYQQRLQAIINGANPPQNQPPALTKFNLDFPGGTPADLVKAIQKVTGKPLNAIIPAEDASTELPPLKLNDVTTPQLFSALAAASRKTVAVQSSNFGGGYANVQTGYGFNTSDNPVTDTTIWYFHAEKPSMPPVISTAPPQKLCQYYSLSPYLDRGFTVDDITTAIQTGWKMSGVNPPPELNYHKETKLLIAFGEPDKLRTINQVLDTLPKSNVPIATANEYTSQIQSMRYQIDELNKKLKAVSMPPAIAVPAEKSGK
jgi:hypothetical protein